MIRNYEDGSRGDVTMFVGTEVEKTSCHGQKTLFFAGTNMEPAALVDIALLSNCTNIYLGANKVFAKQRPNWQWLQDVTEAAYYKDINVTVDFPYHLWEDAQIYLPSYYNLHINLSVELPNIDKYNNVNIKVDDIDFDATNPGVWVFDLNQYGDAFNDWSVYGNDKVLEDE